MLYWFTFHTIFLLENLYSISSSGKILKSGYSWNSLVPSQHLRMPISPKLTVKQRMMQWFNFSVSISIYFYKLFQPIFSITLLRRASEKEAGWMSGCSPRLSLHTSSPNILFLKTSKFSLNLYSCDTTEITCFRQDLPKYVHGTASLF